MFFIVFINGLQGLIHVLKKINLFLTVKEQQLQTYNIYILEHRKEQLSQNIPMEEKKRSFEKDINHLKQVVFDNTDTQLMERSCAEHNSLHPVHS